MKENLSEFCSQQVFDGIFGLGLPEMAEGTSAGWTTGNQIVFEHSPTVDIQLSTFCSNESTDLFFLENSETYIRFSQEHTDLVELFA